MSKVNKKKRQIFPCPKCGQPTRNTRTQGNMTLKKCDSCGECTKVLLNEDHTAVIKVLPKGRGTNGKKVEAKTGMQQWVQECVDKEQQPQQKPILHLKQKPKEHSANITINLDPDYTGSIEEIEAGLRKIIGYNL